MPSKTWSLIYKTECRIHINYFVYFSLPQCKDRESQVSISIMHMLQRSIYSEQLIKLLKLLWKSVSCNIFENWILICVYLLFYLIGEHILFIGFVTVKFDWIKLKTHNEDVQCDSNLKFDKNTELILKPGQQKIHLIQKLNSFHVSENILYNLNLSFIGVF